MEQNQALKYIKQYHIVKSTLEKIEETQASYDVKLEDDNKFKDILITLNSYKEMIGGIEIYSNVSFDAFFNNLEKEYKNNHKNNTVEDPTSSNYTTYLREVLGESLKRVVDAFETKVKENKDFFNITLQVSHGQSYVDQVSKYLLSCAEILALKSKLEELSKNFNDGGEKQQLEEKINNLNEKLKNAQTIDDIVSTLSNIPEEIKGILEDLKVNNSNSDINDKIDELREMIAKMEMGSVISDETNKASNKKSISVGKTVGITVGSVLAAGAIGVGVTAGIYEYQEHKENLFETDKNELGYILFNYLNGDNSLPENFKDRVEEFRGKYAGTKFAREANDSANLYLSLYSKLANPNKIESNSDLIKTEELAIFSGGYDELVIKLNDYLRDGGLTSDEKDYLIGTKKDNAPEYTGGMLGEFANKYEGTTLDILLPALKSSYIHMVETDYNLYQTNRGKLLLNTYIDYKTAIDEKIKSCLDGGLEDSEIEDINNKLNAFKTQFEGTELEENVGTDIKYYNYIIGEFDRLYDIESKYNGLEEYKSYKESLLGLLNDFGFTDINDLDAFVEAINDGMTAKQNLDNLLTEYNYENFDALKSDIADLNSLLSAYNCDSIDDLEALISAGTGGETNDVLDELLNQYNFKDVDALKGYIDTAKDILGELDNLFAKYENINSVEDIENFINEANAADAELQSLLTLFKVGTIEELKVKFENYEKTKTNLENQIEDLKEKDNVKASNSILTIYEYLTGESTTNIDEAIRVLNERLGITVTNPSTGLGNHVNQRGE